MKNSIFLLFGFLLFTLTCAAQTVFRHVTTSTNTQGHITTLDHPQLNGNLNAIIFIMPNWNTGGGTNAAGVTYNENAGVWYNGSRWTIFNEKITAPMPIGLTFNVLIAPAGNPNYFTVAKTNANSLTFSNLTIDHPATNNKPNALLLVTQNWSGVYNDDAPITSYANGKWNISNTRYMEYWHDNSKTQFLMKLGSRFNVMVIENGVVPGFSNASAFKHIAGSSNIVQPENHITFLDHASVNGNQNATIFATPYWGHGDADRKDASQAGGPDNGSSIYAWYDHPNDQWHRKDNFWSISQGNAKPVPNGAKFTIVAVPLVATPLTPSTILLNNINEQLCPKDLLGGDREFDGHGPKIISKVTLRIGDNGKALYADISLWAQETQQDWSTTERQWSRKVYTAPLGKSIASINSDTYSRTQFISPPGGFQFLAPGADVAKVVKAFMQDEKGLIHTAIFTSLGIPINDFAAYARLITGYTDGGNTVVKMPAIEGTLVRFFHIVGDTGGADISDDDNCNDDTRLIRLEFNPVQVTFR